MVEVPSADGPKLFIRSIPTKLSAFIQTERDQYHPEMNNHFAVALGRVARYEGFLRIILDRYRQLSSRFAEIAGRLSEFAQHHAAEQPEGGQWAFTPLEAALRSEHFGLNEPIHFESESFHVFANILLDCMAQYLEHHFTPGTEAGRRVIRGISLHSHDQLWRQFERYARALCIEYPPGLIDQLKDLRARIGEIRDYYIVHERDPYAITCTTWGADGAPKLLRGAVTLAGQKARIPREADTPEELMSALEAYIDTYTGIIAGNRDKSRFMRPLATATATATFGR